MVSPAPNGTTWDVEVFLMTFQLKQKTLLQFTLQDVTERKKVEKDRERLIIELKYSLAKIKTLSGLLPICSSCKKNRNDEGHWC